MSKTNKPKTLAQTIGNLFLNLLVILSVAALIISGYTAMKYKDNPSDAFLFGYRPVLVLTGSMEPTMKVNSICIAEKAEYEDIEVGDIIMYEIDEKLITHRVIGITDEGISTKGDNNNVADAYTLSGEHVKAKIISIWNWTAPLINFGIGKVIAIVAAIILVFTVLIHFLIKILKMPDDEEDASVTDADNKEEIKNDESEIIENTSGNAPPELQDNESKEEEESEETANPTEVSENLTE